MTRDQDAIALAERVLGILEEGSFSATYKFALFTAILDLCIENTDRHGVPPETLTTRQLAERVVELYWNHADPYGSHGTLRQGGVRAGNQAEILRRIQMDRARWADARSETVHRARQAHPIEFTELVDFVEWKLIEMPIPRLQVLGRQEDRFLYDYNWSQGVRRSSVSAYQRGQPSDFDNRLLLRPGVAELLVRLNGVLRPLFRREWAVMVAGMNRLPEAELEDFLFGSERVSLEAVRGPLRELQDDRCFYCRRLDCQPSRRRPLHPVVAVRGRWTRQPGGGASKMQQQQARLPRRRRACRTLDGAHSRARQRPGRIGARMRVAPRPAAEYVRRASGLPAAAAEHSPVARTRRLRSGRSRAHQARARAGCAAAIRQRDGEP